VLRDDRGFILITALLVIALLFPLVLAFNSRVQLNLIQAENFKNSVQALLIARSGVEGSIGILKTDDPTYDSRRDRWGMAFPSFALAAGVLTVSIVDEDGKIPVNRIVKIVQPAQPKGGGTPPQGSTPAPAANGTPEKTTEVDQEIDARLRSLITNLGGKPEIVDALIDWIDADDDVTGEDGAENDYYRKLGRQCKNGPLDSLDELLMIRGFDKDLVVYKKLKEYLTVAQVGDGKINVNTAPLPVLQAVLGTQTTALPQPLNESDIEDIAHYREEHELKTLQDIGGAIKISQDQLGKISGLVKVNSTFFTVNSRYTIGKVVKNVEAMLRRDGITVTTISWREF
jgi:general secretion pathway protein K